MDAATGEDGGLVRESPCFFFFCLTRIENILKSSEGLTLGELSLQKCHVRITVQCMVNGNGVEVEESETK